MHSAGLDPGPWADFPAWPQTCHLTAGPVWWSPGWVGSCLLPPGPILLCQLTFLGPASSPSDTKCSGLSVDPHCHPWAYPAPLVQEQWDEVLAGKSLSHCLCVTHGWWTRPALSYVFLSQQNSQKGPLQHSPLLAFQEKEPSRRRLKSSLMFLPEVAISHECQVPNT